MWTATAEWFRISDSSKHFNLDEERTRHMKRNAISVMFLTCVWLGFGQQPAAVPAASGPAAPGAPGGRGAVRSQPDPVDFDDHPGWKQLFDGKTLSGWDGNPDVWKVADGSIVGEYTSPAGTRNAQTFLIWQGGELADFELKLEIKLEGAMADSGILYRGAVMPPGQGRGPAGGVGGGARAAGGAGGTGGGAAAPAGPPPNPQNAKWNLVAYQLDFNNPGNYDGQFVDAGGAGSRGIAAYRGQMVRSEEGKKPRLLSTLGTLDELGAYIKHEDWNQVHLIVRGNVFIHMVNGHLMSEFIDEDSTKFRAKGLLGLQCAGGGSVKISFRNLWLRSM